MLEDDSHLPMNDDGSIKPKHVVWFRYKVVVLTDRLLVWLFL